MVARRGNTKSRLIDATVKLGAAGGMGAATIQAIAREVGITEGAIYRHYASKEELRWAAYEQVVEQMIEEKQHLMSTDLSVREKIHEWVRLTYAYFDRDSAAFTFVLLTAHPKPESQAHLQVTTAQGRLFMEMIEQAQAADEVRQMSTAVALSHFTGLMLNVPRLINDGQLEMPAMKYASEVYEAVWRVFRPEGFSDTAIREL